MCKKCWNIHLFIRTNLYIITDSIFMYSAVVMAITVNCRRVMKNNEFCFLAFSHVIINQKKKMYSYDAMRLYIQSNKIQKMGCNIAPTVSHS